MIKKIRNKIETMSQVKFIAMMLIFTLTLLAVIIIMWMYFPLLLLLVLLLSDGILIYWAFKEKWIFIPPFVCWWNPTSYIYNYYKKDHPVYYYVGIGIYFFIAFLLILLLLHYF